MAKSKRQKTVTLSKTASKVGREQKDKLVEQIRTHIKEKKWIHILQIENTNNDGLTRLRSALTGSRLFMGRLGVMSKALEEYKVELSGRAGVVVSDLSANELQPMIEGVCSETYAKSGQKATRRVELSKGELKLKGKSVPSSMEAYLRQLGLPTVLVEGKVHLRQTHCVCEEGAQLSTAQGRVLRLLGEQQGEFRVDLVRSERVIGEETHTHKAEQAAKTKK